MNSEQWHALKPGDRVKVSREIRPRQDEAKLFGTVLGIKWIRASRPEDPLLPSVRVKQDGVNEVILFHPRYLEKL